MAFLTKDEILNAPDTRYVTVECPEWGGSVLVKSMNGSQRDRFEIDVVDNNNKKDIRARIAQESIVNPDNRDELMFTRSDISKLNLRNAAPLDRIFTTVLSISGLSRDEVEQMKDELKNDQSGGYGSD